MYHLNKQKEKIVLFMEIKFHLQEKTKIQPLRFFVNGPLLLFW